MKNSQPLAVSLITKIPFLAKPILAGWFLFLYDIQYRYRVSFLGYLWPVIKPILAIIPLIFIGNALNLHDQHQEVPFVLHVVSGYVIWSVFWDNLVNILLVSRRVRKILLRVDIPLKSLAIAGVFYTLLSLFINLILMLSLTLYFDFPVSSSFFLIFIPLFVASILGLGIGIPLASFSYLYQDVNHGLGYINQLLFWTTPVVAYPTSIGIVGLIFDYNPLSETLVSFRNLLFLYPQNSILNSIFILWYPFLVGSIFLVIGTVIYKSIAKKTVEFVL